MVQGLGPFVEREVRGAPLGALRISSNRSSAPVLLSGTKPNSSLISSLAR